MLPEFLSIPIGDLKESPHNHRRQYPKKAMEELVESVKAKGIINPLLVRPLPGKNGHETFEVLGGSRRLRAAKEAKLETVPGLIRRDLSDKDALELIIVDNLVRADVHALDEALGYQELIKKHGYIPEEIAAKVSKSLSYIYQRLKLTDLIEPAQKAFMEERLTPGHAILIARLQPDMQKKALDACNVKTYLDPKDERFDSAGIDDTPVVSVRALTRWIQSNVHLNLKKAAFPVADPSLDPKAGPCTSCPKRTGCNPDLFEDFADKDTCTDPVCFHNKEVLFLRSQQEDAEKKLIPLSSTQIIPDNDRKKLPPDLKRNWKVVKEGSCENARQGVVVYGPGVGDVKTVCCAVRSCKKHHAGTYLPHHGSSGRSESESTLRTPAQIEREKKKEEEKRLNVEIADIAEQRTMEAIVNSASYPMPRFILNEIARSSRNFQSKEEAISKLLKVNPDNLDNKSLAKRIVGEVVCNSRGYWSSNKRVLDLAVKHYKVDTKAIEKKVREELTSKPDPTVQTSAKSKRPTGGKGKKKQLK